MRIAAFQFHTTGSIHENLAKICVTVDRAAELGVQLLAFPECALTGYPPRDIPSSSAVDRASLDKAHKELQVLADHHRMYLIVGTMTRMERGIHNTVMSFCPGTQPISYHKRALWGWDRDNFIPGDEPGIVEIDGVRIGIRICFEVRFPEYFRELYRQKTDIYVIPFYKDYHIAWSFWSVGSVMVRRFCHRFLCLLRHILCALAISTIPDSSRAAFSFSLQWRP